MSKSAIVTLYKDLGNDKGYVVAHHLIMEDGRLKKLNLDQRTEEFPKRGQVFIESGYDNLCELYDKEEPFLLENCQVQDHDFTIYKSTGANARKLYPIIDGAPGVRSYFQFVLPNVKAVFFAIQGSIQGPYQVQPSDEQNGKSFLDGQYYSYGIVKRNYAELDPNISTKYNACAIRINPVNEEDKDYTIFAPSLRQRFIHDINVLIETFPQERKDFLLEVSQKELYQWGESTFKHIDLGGKDILKQLKSFFLKSTESAHEVDRLMFEKYFREIEKTVKWKEYLVAFTKNYLEEDEGAAFLTSFLERRKEKYISDFVAEHKDEIEASLHSKKEELRHLDHELEQMKANKESLKKEAKESLSNSLKKVEDEIHEKSAELIQIVGKIKHGTEAAELESYAKQLKSDEEHLKESIHRLDKVLKARQEEYQQDTHMRIAELKPYIDLLNGITPNVKAPKAAIGMPVEERAALVPFTGSLKDYVLHVREELIQNRVNYPVIELANYLVAIQQNFLTVFAGHPGVGKTYTAEALSKIVTHQENFLSISVNRGWRSSKDLIGCFNPLTNQYQASKTGLYRKLHKHAMEIQDMGMSALYRVVLDEANLSPMEHYWADMIKFSDDYERRLPINDGNHENFILGEGLRFIGTINYDHTTEPLSPRLIDRVPIITIDPIQHYEMDMVDRNNADFSSTKVWEAESIHRLFVPELNEDADYVRYIKQIVNVMHDSLKGEQIIVSKRKYKKILNYCALCWDLFYSFEEKESDQIRAIDLAVTQFILPSINGHGNAYKDKLNALREICVELELERSSMLIKRILEKGEMFNNYNFFS